ncbi:sigma-70 family RNA polymerase sigma factor [Stenotrophomonas sp.]|uniref:sigma-70 family RNA polymerase sigma factor n=1 Tax=Stenotrophomonas sp. TaxID=69392 RepID=UPI0028988A92|nr:sigma-70 family RNA polymerase sigma factor [Stenotrophomonas sp.]
MDPIEQELWRRYAQLADVEARDFLFLRYCPWARSVARRVTLRTGLKMMEWADHVQNAQVGLLEAMMRYDVDYGLVFNAYATPRVRGAVFNGMRCFMKADAADSKKRVPVERLESLLSDEIDELGAFVESIVGLGLGFLLEGQSEDHNAEHYDEENWSSVLHDCLLNIPSRRRQVLIDHYLLQISFQDIARGLGVTKGRVSQLHKEGLAALRRELQGRSFGRSSFF